MGFTQPSRSVGPRGRSGQAFTLIELLVVGTVLAILASLLLPALSATKSTAKKAVCLSQLRQMQLALMMYGGDHDGEIAPRNRFKRWPAQLRPYLDHSNLLRCPSDRFTNTTSLAENADDAPRSYLLNGFMDYFVAAYSPPQVKLWLAGALPLTIRESAIAEPSETITFGEKEQGSLAFYLDLSADALRYLEHLEERRHGRRGVDSGKAGSANDAFADGSVRNLSFGKSTCPLNRWAVTEAGRTNYGLCRP